MSSGVNGPRRLPHHCREARRPGRALPGVRRRLDQHHSHAGSQPAVRGRSRRFSTRRWTHRFQMPRKYPPPVSPTKIKEPRQQTPLLWPVDLDVSLKNGHEHAVDPAFNWGSRGRRFKSCRPDGQRSPADLAERPGQRGFLLSWHDHLNDQLQAYLGDHLGTRQTSDTANASNGTLQTHGDDAGGPPTGQARRLCAAATSNRAGLRRTTWTRNDSATSCRRHTVPGRESGPRRPSRIRPRRRWRGPESDPAPARRPVVAPRRPARRAR
jgi:hypothetical protein